MKSKYGANLPQFYFAQKLEAKMGNSNHNGNVFSFNQILQQDNDEEFPKLAFEKLNQWEVNYYYIPKELEGKLDSFESLLMIIRVIARRDLSLAIAHGKTYLGVSPIWISGTFSQKNELSHIIKKGSSIALGLTEKDHGSDLIANELSCELLNDNVYLMSGEKWLINNATRSRAIVILCKTKNFNGIKTPKDHSLILIDKTKINSTHIGYINKINTLGIRGADISGIQFKKLPIEKDQFIGREGEGLEIILKSLQISRTICPVLSLGGLDTALRAVLSYTLKRKIYGVHISEIVYIKQIIIKSYISLLISESLSIITTRCLHFIPDEMSLISSIPKYFIPTISEKCIEELGKILGARSYLTEYENISIHQKIQRDNRLVSIFDGNTIINLQNMAGELSQIAKKFLNNSNNSRINLIDEKMMEDIFSLNVKVPSFDHTQLSLSSKGKSTITSIINKATKNFYFPRKYMSKRLKLLLSEIESGHKYLIKNIDCQNWQTEKINKEKSILLDKYCWYMALVSFIGIIKYNKKKLQNKSNIKTNKAIFNAIYKYFSQHIKNSTCTCVNHINCNDINYNTDTLIDSIDMELIWSRLMEQFNHNKLFSLFDFDVK